MEQSTEEKKTVDILQSFKYKIDIIWKEGNPHFKAADFGKLLGIKNIHESIRNFDEDEKGIHKVLTNGGTQKVQYLTKLGCIRLIQSTRKNVPEELLNYFNIQEHRFTPLETVFAENIIKAFGDTKIERNYRIGTHIVDLLLPEYNMVIEFDEPYHNSPKQKKDDELREIIVMDLLRKITNKEYGKILRFQSDCDIFEAISLIRAQINLQDAVYQKMNAPKWGEDIRSMKRRKYDLPFNSVQLI